MLGLTFEKLLLVAVVAALVVGPRRLPHHAHELARLIRSFRAFVETARAHAERETGMSLQAAEWDLAQYDPRRIVRDALHEPPSASAPVDPRIEEARRVRPGQRYLVTGPASHPRRILLESLPADDPRRLAAQPEEMP